MPPEQTSALVWSETGRVSVYPSSPQEYTDPPQASHRQQLRMSLQLSLQIQQYFLND